MSMVKDLINKKNAQKGQSMLEAVAALGVIAIVMTALTIAVLLGLGNSGYSKKDNLATQYAQQGMEEIRNLKETNGVVFWGVSFRSGSYYMDENNNFSSADDICSPTSTPTSTLIKIGSSSNYIRTVCVDSSAGSGCDKKVTVSVWWQDGKCAGNGFCKKASITSCFSDTRPPIPT